jgi:hypothetical protein
MFRTQPTLCIDARMLPKQCLNLNRKAAVRYLLEMQWGVAMDAAGLGPTFFEEVYLSLPRTYPIKFASIRKAMLANHCFTSGVFSTDAN